MNSIRFTGHLVATTPWHVTEGAEGNETKIMRAKIAFGADTSDGRAPNHMVGLATSVPLVPSNSIRGRLHRASMGILIDALMARGEFISRDTYQLLSNGGMIGGKDAGELTVGEFVRARRNLHFGLWGGGPRLLPSTVVTCDLLPVCAETLTFGKVNERYRDFAPTVVRSTGSGDALAGESAVASAWSLIDRRMFKRNDDLLRLNAESAKRLDVLGPDSANVVAQYQAEQLAARETRKAAKVATEGVDKRLLSDDDKADLKKSDLTNFLTMEVVIPGTVWPLDLRLHSSCTPAQIALFARSVQAFCNDDRIGSFGRLGFGQFRGWVEIAKDGEPIGRIAWDAASSRHELVFEDSGFEDQLAAELAAVTAAELDEFTRTARSQAVDDAAPASQGKKGRSAKAAAEAQ